MTGYMQTGGHAERNSAFYSAALRDTASKTAGVVGEVYFRTLVRSLAESLDVREAFVAEFAGRGTRVKELARWFSGAFTEPVEFDTSVTPCRDVIEGRVTHYRDGVRELFPIEEGSESYLGVPLRAQDGAVVGHLALLDVHPFEASPDTWVVLQTFASRAAVEVSRKRAHDLLESMMASVMDAILVVGPERRIELCNPAAARMFGFELATDPLNRPIQELVSVPLRTRFEQYAKDVEQSGTAVATPLWSPGDLTAIRASGEAFPVDLTISPTEFGGRKFFTMVLRDLEERIKVERAIERLAADNALLQNELRERQGQFIGGASAMQKLLEEIGQVAPTDATVLVTGETGTGKDLVANAVQESSGRQERILVKVNCATLTRDLIESELFGHEKGAFTGATQQKKGRFELADGGTIFLDEVGELSLEAQAKLLRVLQEREVERLGGGRPIPIDVRVIAATNRNLVEMVAQGTFRSDLYYRLEVFPLEVPPLRERREDIAMLAQHFLSHFSRAFGRPARTIDKASLARLEAYDWPGNVRELQNVIERATILARGDVLTIHPDRSLERIPDRVGDASADEVADGDTLDDVQRRHIMRVLARTDGVVDGPNGAAAILGLHANTLRARMKKLAVPRPPRP